MCRKNLPSLTARFIWSQPSLIVCSHHTIWISDDNPLCWDHASGFIHTHTGDNTQRFRPGLTAVFKSPPLCVCVLLQGAFTQTLIDADKIQTHLSPS